eukprot:m.83066 g.83066  ORF g.83066 m.83066 type:complete len:896 (-) comp12900_c0_seq1:42-2729(-)
MAISRLFIVAVVVAVSVSRCTSSLQCILDDGVDYDHYDIVPRIYHNASSVSECCNLCQQNSHCNFFTYEEHHDDMVLENCWLKTSDKGRHPMAGRVSGSVGRVPPTPHPTPSPAPSPSPPGVNRACSHGETYPFCNTSLSINERVMDLISRIHDADKPSLMTARHSAPLPYLGVPAYDWGVNSIHGDQVSCGTSCATNYPLPVAVAAGFNSSMVEELARMMGRELRALRLEHSCEKHLALLTGSPQDPTLPDACIGLDTWAPNINLNRDPRWGRNWEVGSEDPYVTGQIGIAYSKGFQEAEDPRYLLGVITLKHWMAYNVEENRAGYNSVVSRFDLGDSYLRAWRDSVLKANPAGVMCSYNALNGVPTCASDVLNNVLLRGQWEFDGYITSDSGAIADIYKSHKYLRTAPEAAAAGIKAGCDINSGGVYSGNVDLALISHLLNMTDVDTALFHAFRTRMRLGLFDPPGDQPYEHYPPSLVSSPAHVQLSYEASLQGLTLLQNKKTTCQDGGEALPLRKGNKIAMIGGNAQTKTLMAGGTGGGLLSAEVVCKCAQNSTDWCCVQSPFEGVQAANGDMSLTNVSLGADITHPIQQKDLELSITQALVADAVIFVVGGDWSVEHEGMDRSSIELPGEQAEMIMNVTSAMKKAGKCVPVVCLLIHGGSMDITPLQQPCDAILDAYYPGMYGARAIADVIFGDFNPSGRTPYTFYRSGFVNRISMDEFSMAKPPGRGYRYLDPQDQDIIYPFGFGLSYTTFSCSPLTIPTMKLSNSNVSNVVSFNLTVTNTGSKPGQVVAMVYFVPPSSHAHPINSSYMKLQKQLFSFHKSSLLQEKGNELMQFSVGVEDLVLIDKDGNRTSITGEYGIIIELGDNGTSCSTSVTVTGMDTILESLPSGL